ncbi:hypothetical protein BBG19_0143 [Francisella sp. MA067296]|nr:MULTISPECIES: hypothetical protein [Francisella]APC90881.1 hypothetical protein BBG19_0143 [Francisella sp. MA067296]
MKIIKNFSSFDYIVADRYFASKANLKFFNKHKLKYVIGIANNRLVAKSKANALVL